MDLVAESGIVADRLCEKEERLALAHDFDFRIGVDPREPPRTRLTRAEPRVAVMVDDPEVLTDRGTWLSFGNRGNLTILVEGDERLFNPYGAMLVNPERHPHVKAADARAFIEWIVSDDGRAAISGFQLHGEVLFHPARSNRSSP